MTNLVAAIAVTLSTNWTTYERVSPVIREDLHPMLAVVRNDRLRQRGQILMNTVATITWNGREIETVLESVDITASMKEPLIREVFDQFNPFQVPGKSFGGADMMTITNHVLIENSPYIITNSIKLPFSR